MRLTDRNTGATLNRRSFVAGRIRSMNDSVVKDADNLHIAIQTNRKVRFKYFHYDREKKKGYSHNNEAYVVSPFGLLWNDGNYYLYAYDGEKLEHSVPYVCVRLYNEAGLPAKPFFTTVKQHHERMT